MTMSANIEELRKRVEQYIQDNKMTNYQIGIHVTYGDLIAFNVFHPATKETCSGLPIFVLLNEETTPRLAYAEEAYPLMDLAWP